MSSSGHACLPGSGWPPTAPPRGPLVQCAGIGFMEAGPLEPLVRRDLRRLGDCQILKGNQSIPVEPEALEAAFLLAGFHPVNKFSTKEWARFRGARWTGEGAGVSCTCAPATLNQREASDISQLAPSQWPISCGTPSYSLAVSSFKEISSALKVYVAPCHKGALQLAWVPLSPLSIPYNPAGVTTQASLSFFPPPHPDIFWVYTRKPYRSRSGPLQLRN